MTRKSWILLALAAAGCAKPVSPPGLTATLVSPTDIELHWPDDDPAASGRMVEFATDPGGPWTTLQFLPAHATTYTHPDLLPQTPFYYRIRPFAGPVSAAVLAGSPPTPASPGSAPAAFQATSQKDGTLKFTWTDRSPDEDGFLVEMRRPADPDFAPVEVSDPNTTSCVLSPLPGENGATYRIRAFHYGPPSPIAHQTTGKDS